MADYAHPEALVSTDWVAQHANDANVRVVEVDVDTKAYDEGHVPGAMAWAWNTQLCDTVRRDILSQEQFEELMSASGVTPDTTLVIYGDNNNWFAAWAFWQAKIYGHGDVRLMNGGPQEVAGGGPRADHDSAARRRGPTIARRRRTFPCAPSCRRCRRRRRRRTSAHGGRAQPAGIQRARFWRLRGCRKPASAAATFRARAAFPGARPAMTTARSNRPTNCARFTARRASTGRSR